MTRNPTSSTAGGRSHHSGMDNTLARALGLTPHSTPRPTTANADFLSFSLYCPSNDPQVIADLSANLPLACATFTANHIWSSGHPLTISPKPFAPAAAAGTIVGNRKPVHLLASSTLAVAECIDDEWFALWVLKSLTRQFTPHLALMASDADGQFVLIEAAEHLPSWVDPDSVEHRVWWVGGELMLIPPSVVAEVETEADGAAVVLDLAGRTTIKLLAPEAVKKHLDGVFRTIEHSHAHDSRSATVLPAPARLPSTHHHYTQMYLPPLAAFLLHPSTLSTPEHTNISADQLVALAIHAVHTRDSVSMRKSREMPLLIPSSNSSSTPWVTVPLRLTRYLYALLNSTRVDPIPPALASAFPEGVPPSLVAAGSGDAQARRLWRAWHNGAKLALGLEMILCDSTAVAGVAGWVEARAEIVDYIKSPKTAGMAASALELDVGEEDAEDWMQVTDEDLQQWSSSSLSAQGNKVEVEEVVKAMNAFGDGESGLDGIAAVTIGSEDEDEDGESDDDDELLFDPDKFDALFTSREQMHHPNSDEGRLDSDSDSDLDELIGENLPGYRGDAAEASEEGDEVDEVQALANLLASLEGQEGRMGPAAGLLAHLGIQFVPGDGGEWRPREQRG